ncbi:MAG: hypothetical protein RBR06_10150 [Desulfuromonadaceae bacterium]|nr:hypothetical protein [Desulfuromonadaceae bacterium]
MAKMNQRNIGLEILEGIRAIKRGEGKPVEVAEPAGLGTSARNSKKAIEISAAHAGQKS